MWRGYPKIVSGKSSKRVEYMEREWDGQERSDEEEKVEIREIHASRVYFMKTLKFS